MSDLSVTPEKLTEWFQWFHAHPELSYAEYETTAKIRELLAAAAVEILPLPLETGLVAQINGKRSAPALALRCDIDALSVNEETDLPYKSQYPGKMHACGHDAHIVILLGAACLLAQKPEMAGTVKLIFQPAEESSVGARKITQTGVLSDVEAIFGIHCAANQPVGALSIQAGYTSAAVDRFAVVLTGVGGHAANPHNCVDPMIAASQLVVAAQTIISRDIDPLAQGLLSFTHIEGGHTWNVIPPRVFLEGTVRTLDKELRRRIEERFRELTRHIAAAFRVTADFDWQPGCPSVNNDPELTEFAAAVARGRGFAFFEQPPNLGGEDFAYYEEITRGAFISIGTGPSPFHHHPRFQIDPAALYPAAEYLAHLARSYWQK